MCLSCVTIVIETWTVRLLDVFIMCDHCNRDMDGKTVRCVYQSKLIDCYLISQVEPNYVLS
jgi:hypothetical protein